MVSTWHNGEDAAELFIPVDIPFFSRFHELFSYDCCNPVHCVIYNDSGRLHVAISPVPETAGQNKH